MVEHTVTVTTEQGQFVVQALTGSNLRQVLLDAGLSPYTNFTRQLNCGGRGLCATCGVWIDNAPPPTHWHDQLADRFGYPRLSCQITMRSNLTIRMVDKWIWGAPQPKKNR
jgi:ferredoxin